MNIPIIYEDEALLILDKPSGIVVNKAESVKGETIQDWAEKRIQNSEFRIQNQEENKNFCDRAGIVHRLDKETSGLLIIAKTPQAFVNLQAQFKERKIIKKYHALVHGIVAQTEGEIKASIARLPWNRERFGIIPDGKEAVTGYKVMKTYKGSMGNFSLLEVTPRTGRTHQIRVHFKYLGFSVVSDKLYAGRKTYKRDLKFCPRLFLHAVFLGLQHPEGGQRIEVKSSLPKELEEVLHQISN